MVRVARSVLDCADDAQECAAEALVQVLSQGPVSVANPEAFLVTVSKRRALDLRRSRERERRRHATYAVAAGTNAADVAEDVVNKAEARWADATARELLAPRVYQMLRMVSDEVPVGQIAAEFALSVPAVQSHLRRARRTMRTALAKALAVLGLLGLGLRRLVAVSAPVAAASLAAIALLASPPVSCLPRHAGAHTSRAHSLPPLNRDVVRSTLVAAAGLSPRRAERGRGDRPSSSTTTSRTPITSVKGPSGASATVGAGDSGTHESGTIQEVLACVQNVTLSWQRIGC